MATSEDELVCPQCGRPENELLDEYKPRAVRTLGDTQLIQCWICGKLWLHKAASENNKCR
jgi:uncharacterized Zn finger protein